jgi:hypothetical protein
LVPAVAEPDNNSNMAVMTYLMRSHSSGSVVNNSG